MARMLGGLVILGAVAVVLGPAPFVDAARGLDARLLGLALVIACVSTLASAWRWRLVARGLGAELSLPTAVAGCYRAQLLNSTLPGGVLGDVHRGVLHGRVVGGVGLGLRTVWWERVAGQVVQAVLTVGVLVLVASPLRPPVEAVGAVVGLLGLTAVVLLRRPGGSSRVRAAARPVVADVRRGLLGAQVWPGVVLASVIVVAGHWLTFVLAARAAGATAPWTTLLPAGLLVLVASGIPINVAGWGPREGAAAWVFGAAGLGASAGVAAAAVYGVLALVATSPGLLVIANDAVRSGWASSWGRAPQRRWRQGEPVPVRVRVDSDACG
jgi:hypothetical protein